MSKEKVSKTARLVRPDRPDRRVVALLEIVKYCSEQYNTE